MKLQRQLPEKLRRLLNFKQRPDIKPGRSSVRPTPPPNNVANGRRLDTCEMEGARIEMAHDDVWDDSALIRSWDEALDEYKVRTRLCLCLCLCAGRFQTVSPKPHQMTLPSRTETDWQAQKYHSIHASGGKLEDLPEYVRHASPGTFQTGPNLPPPFPA